MLSKDSGHSRGHVRVVVAMVAMLLVGACGQSTAPSATPSASSGDQSAYAQLFSQVGPNGEVTKEMALEAFSLAIAPLPGVTVPTGPQSTLSERADGTFAIDWLTPYLDQITPDQLAAVKAALSPGPDTIPVGPAPSPAVRTGHIEFASNTSSDLAAMVAKDIPIIEAKLGRTLSFDSTFPRWYLSVNSSELTVNGGQHALAYACGNYVVCPTTSSGNVKVPSDYCLIVINPSLGEFGDASATASAIAHELFHCFQYDYRVQHGIGGRPSWIIEGEAAWAGEQIGGPSDLGRGWWAAYLGSRKTPLWSRAYDAIGFYMHLQEEGIDPWKVMDPILGAPTNELAFDAAGANDQTFLNTWASGTFRDESLGQEWDAYGPWADIGAPAPSATDLSNGDSDIFAAYPVTVSDIRIDSAADIVVAILQSGNARIHTDPRVVQEAMAPAPTWLCTKVGGCDCPPGQHYEGPPLVDVGPTLYFGITGGLEGGGIQILGKKLSDYCKPGPTQTPQPPCQSNCGHSNGDPHLRTTNRYVYAFQAAGEFTLLRNADSSIDIQARQEPYSSQRFPGVSTNTAVAARDNGHTVGVYVVGDSLVLHVDGQQIDPSAVPDLGPGAYIRKVTDGFEIGFPDGSTLDALSVGHWGINAVVNASQSMLSAGVGILGPITSGGMGVPALPDGMQLPAAPDTLTRNKILYSTFADAWRVTDATTLFDYDPGKSTESYTDRNFPSDADQATLDAAMASPDPAQRQAAQSACASLTDPDLQTDCQYDVFATGDDGFAQSYEATQNLYESGVVSKGPPSEAPATPGAPATSGPVTDATKVTELSHLQSATIGRDNTVYASIDDATQAPQLIAIDPVSGAVKQQTPMRVETDIHFAADSIWAAGQAADADGHSCTVTRYDPSTLAKQGDYPIPCGPSAGAPRIVSMGDAVWFVSNDGTSLVQIDPSTNAPGKSVPLPQASGCCRDSQGAVFCYCGNSDTWRLTASDSAFADMGNYNNIFPAGTGFWVDQEQAAAFVDSPGGPSVALQFTDPAHEAQVVGGDPAGVYLQGEPPDTPLGRLATDGSPLVELAKAPVAQAGTIDETDFDYLTGQFPWFATPQGYVHLWEFKDPLDGKDALWLQWAPLP